MTHVRQVTNCTFVETTGKNVIFCLLFCTVNCWIERVKWVKWLPVWSSKAACSVFISLTFLLLVYDLLAGDTHIWKWYISAAQCLKIGGLGRGLSLKIRGLSERPLTEKWGDFGKGVFWGSPCWKIGTNKCIFFKRGVFRSKKVVSIAAAQDEKWAAHLTPPPFLRTCWYCIYHYRHIKFSQVLDSSSGQIV